MKDVIVVLNMLVGFVCCSVGHIFKLKKRIIINLIVFVTFVRLGVKKQLRLQHVDAVDGSGPEVQHEFERIVSLWCWDWRSSPGGTDAAGVF